MRTLSTAHKSSLFVGLCLAGVGVASNILSLPGVNGTPIGPKYSLAAIVFLLCSILIITRVSSHGRDYSISVFRCLIAGFWPLGLLALQAIALIRTAITEEHLMIAATVYLLFLLIFVIIYWCASQYLYAIGRSSDYWRYLAWSVIVLSLISLLLKCFSLTGNIPDGIHPSMLLSLLGITAKRPLMPLLPGLNGAGLIFGASVCSATVLALIAGISWRTPLLLLITLSTMVGLLWIDTRGALLAVLVALFFTLPQKKIRIGLFFIFAVLVWLFLFTSDLSDFSWLSRSGQTITTSRDIIWAESIDFLLDPDLIHIVGYGAWGQYVSGLSRAFYGLFTVNLFEVASLHNALLQIIFDSGYVGLIFFTVCWISLLQTAHRQFIHESNGIPALKLALVIYILISGLFEAFAGYSSSASMFLYVGVLVGFVTDMAFQRKSNIGRITN